MLIKFSLNEDLHANLIEKIKARAGKNSFSKAAKLLMIEWSVLENSTLRDQKSTTSVPLADQKTELDINLDGLDELSLEF